MNNERVYPEEHFILLSVNKVTKGGENMNKSIVITIVVALVVGGAGFFGGMQYQKSQATSGQVQFAQGGGRFGANARFGQRGNMATFGKVVSSDANSITIAMTDGSSKIINISSVTRIEKTSAAALSDLTNGTQVAVVGTTNSDGSITAQNVQINPMFRQRPSGTPTQ